MFVYVYLFIVSSFVFINVCLCPYVCVRLCLFVYVRLPTKRTNINEHEQTKILNKRIRTQKFVRLVVRVRSFTV